jgi:hypothetical protein
MAVSELSATAEVTRGGYRAPDRRAREDNPAPPPLPVAPPPASESLPDTFPADVAFYAGRFRADLSQLGLPAEPEQQRSDGSESHGDPALFDFFGNLSVLLLAVRSGDLPRAQAAADALEMEVLVERSAAPHGESASGRVLGGLGRLIGAAQSRHETAARAAAKDLAAKDLAAKDLAAKDLAAELRGAPARALAPPEPPPDPYAGHEADVGGAAYDTLAHYFDAETPAA